LAFFLKKTIFNKKKLLKTSKANFGCSFLLYNLINTPNIQILIVICEIHQFHLHFSHGALLRSLEISLCRGSRIGDRSQHSASAHWLSYMSRQGCDTDGQQSLEQTGLSMTHTHSIQLTAVIK